MLVSYQRGTYTEACPFLSQYESKTQAHKKLTDDIKGILAGKASCHNFSHFFIARLRTWKNVFKFRSI